MKNKIIIKSISYLLILLFFVKTPISVYAKESDDSVQSDLYGRLPVYLLDNGGDITYLEVYIHKDNLYVKASSFANEFGYSIGYTDDGVQLLQAENSSDEDYSWTFLSNFKNKSKAVWVFDGEEVTNYTAPFKTIKNDQGTWIPLQFAIKIMGREMVINSGGIVVSEPHETIDTIINNVDGVDSRMFPTIVAFNNAIERTDVEVTTSPILTQAIAAESKKNNWIGRAVFKSVSSGVSSKSGVDELATYLVSNLGPENTAIYRAYYELMLMYMDQGHFLSADAIIDSALDSDFSTDTTFEGGKSIVESYAAAFVENNSSTINYNYAFDNAYIDLTGYSPIDKKWTNGLIYNDFFDTMITYKGDPKEGTKTNIEYFSSFLGPLSDYSSEISEFYVIAICARNELAENTYSRNIFEKYLLEKRSHTADEGLINSLTERVENYTEYQKKLLGEQTADIYSIDEDDIEDAFVDKIDKYKSGFSSFYSILTIRSDFEEYQKDLNEIAQNELMADNSNYILARGLADEIGGYISSNKEAEWAYIFYRTEYISNYYHYKALENSKASNYMSNEEISEIKSLLSSVMYEDTYQLAALRSGINYGLNPKDNTSYNKSYNDSKYIEFVEEFDMSKGNSNANINNCGFVTTSTNYMFYVDADYNYKAYMESLNEKGTRVEVSNGWAHWLNSYENESVEYLIYVNENLDLCSYNTETGETVTLSKGSYSNAMVAYGYIFAKEKGALYRLELPNGSSIGEKVQIVSNVGECAVYDDDIILFSDTSGEVYKTDFDGAAKTDLSINSNSFDISNGNLYFSNNNDARTLYVYNIMTKISTKLGSTENIYCINVNSGLVYFKIDDGKSSSLVYSIVPFIDKAIPRVYSWKGPDDDWGYINEDDDVDSGRDSRRVYNISDGKIYNEGYTWILTEYPLVGVSVKGIFGYLCYKVSDIFNSEEE